CTGAGPVCNNNTIETGEQCDGTALAGLTCTNFGFTGGSLACVTDCTRFNTAGCTGGGSNSCGDTLANGLDSCDGSDWGGPAPTCDDLGLGTGNLTCTTSCGPDVSGCQTTDFCNAAGWYGDGWCDPCEKLGGVVDDADCAASCLADDFCSDYYAWGAWTCKKYGLIDPDCGLCGNNALDGNEWCDGTTFFEGADTCVAFGYGTGTLSCATNCIPDFSQCGMPACNNNIIEGSETCDGSDLGGAACTDFGYTGGTLDCLGDCSDYDFTACTAPTQGDCCQPSPGAAGCDDTLDPGLESCVCSFDSYCCTVEWDSICVDEATTDCGGCQAGTCGDGSIQPGEVCDGTNLAGRTCADFGFSGGSLTCETCTSISTAACTGG
ncbi:MAG: hypothetical protein HYZ27_04250, partial [Deltaproteobacteria bacterium]|nr:hypothetical protein [Deltaproteobacteria bacterium]